MAKLYTAQELAKLGYGPKKTQVRGRGGTATSLISEGGALGGAIAGGTAGSVVPGIGTLIGAIIGAGVGGTAGRGVENKVRNNQNFLGKGGSAKSAFGEGALSAALTAVPIGGVSRAAKAVQVGAKPTVTSNFVRGVQTASQDSANRISGLTPNIKVGGRQLGQKGVDELHLFLKNDVKVKNALPQAQLRQVEAFQKAKTSELESLITKNNVKINTAGRRQILNTIEKPVGINIGKHPLNKELTRDFNKVTDLKKLETFRKKVDKLKNFERSASSPDPERDQIAGAWRDALDKHSASVVPGLKDVKKSYALSTKATEALAKASGKLPQNKSLLGTTIPGSGRLFQKTLAETAPKINAAASRIGTGFGTKGVAASEAVKQGAGRQLAGTNKSEDLYATDALHGFTPDEQSTAQYGPQTAEEKALAAEYAANPTDPKFSNVDPAIFGYPEDPTSTDPLGGQASQSQSQYSLEQALADIQRDPKNSEKYLSIYKTVAASEKTTKPSAAQQKTQQATKNAENVINEIENAYKTVGGAQGALVGTARNLGGKVRLDQNANYYNSQRQGYLSRIARAFGEVGTLSDQDIARAVNLIPDLADNPQNAARKLAGLRSLLAQSQQTSAGTDDLSAVLAQLQQQGAY